jgi:hypothetical protein
MSTTTPASKRGKTSRHVRRPKPGDLASLRRTLWGTIRRVEHLIHDDTEDVTVDQQLRAVHALAALAGQYLKATEAAELVERIEALEAAVASEGSAAWPAR